MKRLALSFLTSSILASSAFAWVGGPFDNNSFYGRDINGTFQGVMTGKNISGLMVFGTTSASQSGQGSESEAGVYGNGGRALIFAEGSLLIGDVSAVADMAGRKLSLAIDASRGHGMTDTASTTSVTNNVVETTTTVTSGTGSEATTTTTTKTTTTPIITTTRYYLEGTSQLRGVIDAKFSKVFPTLNYSGNGEVLYASWTRLGQDTPDDAPYTIGDGGYVKVRVSGVRTSTSNPVVSGTLPWSFPTITSDVTTTTGTPVTTTN